MRGPVSRLQLAALMAAAAVGLHQARWALGLAAGGHEAPGHGYLDAAIPLVGGFLVLALALFVHRLAVDPVDRRSRRPLWVTWLSAAAGLLAVYCVQETAEALLASWSGGALVAAFGNGGWVAVPLALALGGLVALTLRGASAIASRVARRSRPARRYTAAPLTFAAGGRDVSRCRAGLSRNVAPRGPPLLCVA